MSPRVLAFALLFAGCDCERSPGPQPGASAEPAKTSPTAVVRTTRLFGISVPAGCAIHADLSGPEAEGAPRLHVFAGCPLEPSVLTTWLDAESKAGRIERVGTSQYRSGSFILRVHALDERPSGIAPPPPGSRSLLSFDKRGAPEPCPPCRPGEAPPPGCTCSS